MDPKEIEIEHLKAEVDYYKKMLLWYRETYETRSLLGVVKDRVKKEIKDGMQMHKAVKPLKLNFGRKAPLRMPPAEMVDRASFYSIHEMDEKLLRIGIFVHLFYQDLWPEINGYLQNIGINFDLLITVNEADPNTVATIAAIRKQYPKAIILQVANKGLDIGPFFEMMNLVISKNLKYDYVLKIHTKKSLGVNAAIGESWRRKSYESLMGSQSIVFHILRLFNAKLGIGMIGPYESRMSVSVNDVKNGGNANAKNIAALSKRLEIRDKNLDFFGGTMFWVRWSIFEEKFRKKTLSIDEFEPGYKKDELLSHAVERLLASIVRDANYELYEINKVNDYIFYKSRKKKICWVHPGYGIGGGNRVIFDICQEQLKYYDVYSISFMRQPFTNWMDVNHNVLNFSNENEARYFIETLGIDYVFATGWQTVDFVKGLSSSHKKFYFIQDYEPWFADADSAKAKLTYKNSFDANIVIAAWLKGKLMNDHQLNALFVRLGTKQLPECKNDLRKVTRPRKILFYFKLKTHRGRGSDLILLLLKKLAQHKDLELNVFGHEDPKISGIHFHGEIHKDKLTSLYKNNDIFVDLSRHRGIATIALEVAQFGVVSLLSSSEFGLKEYGFVNNENCVFVSDVEDAYKKVLALTNNEEMFAKMRNNVLALSETFQWKYTVNDFNQIIDL